MSILGYFVYRILGVYSYLIIAYVLINIFISFNIINDSNRFINIIMDSLYKMIEPLLVQIRKIIPIFGSLDLSPVVLLIIVDTIQRSIMKYGI
ncbi:YggT family protein [Rickettsiales bacterium]|nr:YggT family protein [Rickettsiales bacterium]